MHKLIILGELHTFSDLEIESLKNKFEAINFIKYKEVNTNDVVTKISSIISKEVKTIIVLNTKASVPNKLIVYLTKLEHEGIHYLSIQSFMEKYLHKCYIPSELRDISFLEKIQPFSKFERSLKFIVDYSLAIFLLIISTPFMIYATYRIKKESPGPIFFKQKRIGLNGKEFTCIKFRSMSIDAEKNGAKFATKNDTRVYSWGRTMRITRIDELPQIWNVLKGDMHLIGPRPERKIWIEQFEREIPYYNERHITKPGLTGWAQVLYPYGSNTHDAKQKLMYDLYYIKHWNILLELKTIWKTIIVMISKQGV